MKGSTFALGLVAALAALPAAAHHSFDGSFDRNELMKLKGTVTEFTFANPHSYFLLDVVGQDGETQVWHVETTSALGLGNHGWNKDSIAPGEELTVEGYVARSGKRHVRLRSMNHPDGSKVALWLPPCPAPVPGA